MALPSVFCVAGLRHWKPQLSLGAIDAHFGDGAYRDEYRSYLIKRLTCEVTDADCQYTAAKTEYTYISDGNQCIVFPDIPDGVNTM